MNAVQGARLASLRFHCPGCRGIQSATGARCCAECGYRYLREGNVYDLVSPTTDRGDELSFYDATYASKERTELKPIASSLDLWDRPEQPELAIVRKAASDLGGKDVLLLGNGSSEKELAFLFENPRILVYSDLSCLASLRIQRTYDFSGFDDRIMFSAVDAQDIPFVTHSFDVVYGFAMAHHLPRLDVFIEHVGRVLRPGGRAIFMDDAYSPVWHYSKQTILKPLMHYSHKTTGISPEDYRFSMTGGFKEAQLRRAIEAVGGKPWFERTSLFTYLAFRGMEKLLSRELAEKVAHSPLPRITTALDRAFGRFEVLKANQIRLIWGFSKPAAGA